MIFWLLHTFICCAYGKNIDCNNELVCPAAITSTFDDSVSGTGYKSLFQSPSFNASDRHCSGALSCQQTPKILVSNQLACSGALSCSNTTDIEAIDTNSKIYGIGSNSLTNTNISCTATCICYGAKSCAHSTISVFDSCTVSGYGALSLFGAIINVIGATLTAEMYAYYAGYQASIYCQNGSICDIECSDNGCDGLSIICDIDSRCTITPTLESVSILSPNADIILETKDVLAWNATIISEINEQKCSNQSTDKTFDTGYATNIAKPEQIYTTNVGPICCRAVYACSSSSITYNSTPSVVVCSGESSCRDTQIISNSNALQVECSARTACWLTSISANRGSVYCSSFWSCYASTITKISNVYCSGYRSCDGVNIISSGTDIAVYFIGFEAGWSTSVTCNETDHCNILCSGHQACALMALTCYGTCSVECSNNAICPEGWTVAPTITPTWVTSSPTLPTIPPSFSPSKVPTTGAPTADTLYPSVMPSVEPTQMPTVPPTTYFPTVIPTSEPTLEPTNNPTETPSVNPSMTPTAPPTSHPTMIPTLSPSEHSTYVTEDINEMGKSQEQSLQMITNTFEYANIAVVAPFLFIGITGFIDAKFLRVNDVFSIGKIVQPLLQTLDAMSDIFLCWEVSLIYDYAQYNQSVYLVLLICMTMFILIPIMFSMIQLATISNKYWINDQKESAFYVVNSAAIRVWFGKYVYFVYIVSVITGSSFGATSLFNSNLYGLSIFDMGLSESTLAHFKTKRIYSVILCENIPQLIFQFIYWTISKTKSIIVVVSMVYSGISILVTLITIYTQRRIIYMQQAVCIQFDVTGASISTNSAKLRNRFHGIQRELSVLFGVDKAVIEVIRPIIITNGIRIILLIKVDGDINEYLVSFKKTMHDPNNSLLKAVQKGWNLDDVSDDGNVQISNIQLSAKQSKQSIQETRHIQLSKTTNNNQEIESLAN